MGNTDITIGAIALILAKLVSPALNLVLLAVMAKTFGSNLVGGYYLPLTWLFIFQAFAALGVGDVVAREVGRFPERAGRCFANGLLLGLVSSIVSSIIMVGLVQLFHYPREIELAIRLVSASLPPIAVALVCEGFYIARQQTKYMVLVSFFEAFFSVGLNLFLLCKGYGLLWLMGVIVAARIFSAVIHLCIIRRKFSNMRLDWEIGFLRSMVPATIVFGLGKILGLIVLKGDVIILSKLRDINEVGLYIAAGKLMEVWLMLPHAFGFAAFPILAREFYRSREDTREILIHTTRRLFTIAVPIVIGVILFSRYIVSLIYGKSFASVSPAVQLLMLTFLLMCGDILLGNTCRAVGRQNFDLGILAVNAAINIALNFLLIPHYGMIGACYATLASMSVSLASRWYYVTSKIFELGWTKAVLKPFALVTPPALAVLPFQNKINPLLLGMTFIGIYFLGLWLTKRGLVDQS
jgi:O-antigen/teichoic acid export membrane protein